MKNKNLAYTMLGIAFIVFNVIAFVIPNPKLASFWVTYIFTTVAFIAQIFVWNISLNNAETLKSKFIGFPIIYIGIVYLIIQLITFAIFFIFPYSPTWIALVTCTVIIGFSSIFLITTEIGRNEVVSVEQKVQEKVVYIKELQTDVELLLEDYTDINIKSALTSLAEKIKYSDPISNNSLYDLEKEIEQKVKNLKVTNNNDLLQKITEIEKLLNQRNKKCKILK